ncbi:MAG TPA: hypothetical protein VJM08_14670 [Anaerolineales bacterium]|nr:hypothetical protein [Anaerolineales bacterium]
MSGCADSFTADSYLSRAAAEGSLSSANFSLQIQTVVASAAALLALIVATALAVYKPRGMTTYGWRKQQAQKSVAHIRESQ